MFGVDGAGRIAFASESFAERLATTPAYLTGTPLDTVVALDGRTGPREVTEALSGSEPGTTRSYTGAIRRDETAVPATVEFAATASDQVVGTVAECEDTGAQRFRHLFEQSEQAIVSFEIVDVEPIVRAVNTAFVETFGYSRDAIVGESLNEFIVPEERAAEAADYDKRTASGETNHAVVTRKTVNGRRDFTYRGLSYTAPDGGRYGFAIYTDVTADRRRRRRLQVLHRVLRHNLRNDLSVVVGMADYIDEATDDTTIEQSAAKIVTAAERLSSVSEQARNVESALDNPSEQPADAADLVQSVVATYRDADVQWDGPESIAVAGGPALYDAVENLVDNAVAHTPAETAVRVTVGSEDGEAFVRVADGGPGIPDIERAAVFEDRDITTLTHGTGLGLWLARWVAEAAGGELRYDRVDGWTVVTMWLPRVDTDDRFARPRSDEGDPTPTR